MIRRVLWAFVLFIAVTIVTYIIFFIISADPARAVAGKQATPEMIHRARVYLGIDKPVPVQYARFLWRLTYHHSLGRSFANRESVNSLVGEAAPVTASLVIGGAFVWLLIALPLGILSALRPRSLLDRSSMPVATILGMDIGTALGGAIFTESIYGLPGLGHISIQGLNNLDLPTVQGVVVFPTTMIIIFNLVVDLLYAWIDPRIRLA